MVMLQADRKRRLKNQKKAHFYKRNRTLKERQQLNKNLKERIAQYCLNCKTMILLYGKSRLMNF